MTRKVQCQRHRPHTFSRHSAPLRYGLRSNLALKPARQFSRTRFIQDGLETFVALAFHNDRLKALLT
jgi:hypothetical protein